MDRIIQLHHWLLKQEKVAVAYSGGIDSSMLLAFAVKVLGRENVMAISASSPLDRIEENEDGMGLVEQLGVKHIIIQSNELDDEEFTKNDQYRCYVCKQLRLEKVKELSTLLGYEVIIDGSNMDDLRDYRPGMKALEQLGIRSPMIINGLHKKDIRFMAKELGVSYWNKPSNSCYATRIPTGTPITLEKIERIKAGEKAIEQTGCGKLRLRDHGDIARIEVLAEDMELIMENREWIDDELKKVGYRFVALDLVGYRMGNMN